VKSVLVVLLVTMLGNLSLAGAISYDFEDEAQLVVGDTK
jgi:hypothetical protein